MKKFALYLPQYHEIPENNEWWGKGFTEWTNVKKAKPLFIEHVQPKHPLDDNYYVLDNVDVLKWQANLAKEYCIDGMIFYHYYFENKKLLEKPAELLLSDKSIDMKFFFCWANHSWKRSWEGKSTILIEQNYGDKNSWLEHFNYLLPFFRDQRYEKKNNKPLFMIFNPHFDERDEMFAYFDELCKENGFAGIHIIHTCNSYKQCVSALNIIKTRPYECTIFARQPIIFERSYYKGISIPRIINYLRKRLNYPELLGVKKYDGDKFVEKMKKTIIQNRDVCQGLFFEWDNTPRHGRRGYIITPLSRETFTGYMDLIKESEYVFINAWNEWCEGMMLEPTEENGYKYLEWIKEWSENE